MAQYDSSFCITLDNPYHPREYHYFSEIEHEDRLYLLMTTEGTGREHEFIILRVNSEEEAEQLNTDLVLVYDVPLMEKLFACLEQQQPERYAEFFAPLTPATSEQVRDLEEELNVRILTASPRLLDKDGLETIRRLNYYMDGKRCFVLFDPACAVLTDADSLVNVIQAAFDQMRSVLGYHPDFNPLVMDDGKWLLVMQDNVVCSRSPSEISFAFRPEEYSFDRVPLSAALYRRGRCMTACLLERVLAVVYNNPEEVPSLSDATESADNDEDIEEFEDEEFENDPDGIPEDDE